MPTQSTPQTFRVSKTKTTKTCRVCANHGNDPTGHLPGDDCPTIQGFYCGYCKGTGHSINCCPVLKAKKEDDSWNLISLEKYNDRRARIASDKIAQQDGWRTETRRGRGTSTSMSTNPARLFTEEGQYDLLEEGDKMPEVFTGLPTISVPDLEEGGGWPYQPLPAPTSAAKSLWGKFVNPTEHKPDHSKGMWADDSDEMDPNDPFFA